MITENLDIFFDTAGFGTTATSGSLSVVGIFERQYAEVNNVEGYYPTFLCKTTDAANMAKGSTWTIGTESFKVLSKRPDGTGVTMIIFEAT